MITKKSIKGNLEKNKNTYLLIGFIISILIVYFCFEFVTSNQNEKNKTIDDDVVYIENLEKTIKTDEIKKQFNKNNPSIILKISNDVEDTLDWSKIFGGDFNDPYYDYIPDTIPIIQESFSELPRYFVDQMPLFPGGPEALDRYLIKNCIYPKICRDLGITGVVLVQFVVEKDGSVSDVKVLVPVYPDLDNEAIRVIKNSPKWIPGKQIGKPVRVYYQIPIRFTLK